MERSDAELAQDAVGGSEHAYRELVTRYGGTSAGSEGAMILAAIDYDQAKYQEGISVLENAAKGAPTPMEVQLRSLIGDGYL